MLTTRFGYSLPLVRHRGGSQAVCVLVLLLYTGALTLTRMRDESPKFDKSVPFSGSAKESDN